MKIKGAQKKMKDKIFVRIHTLNYINQLKGKKAFISNIKMTDIY